MTPPLVLLHAFPLDSRLFDPVRPVIAARTRLLTPDLRGFGSGPDLGSPPPEPDLGLLADDVVALLDREGIDRAVIGGVSMGGYIALAMLRRHQDRVAGLVLADTRCGADDEAALGRRRSAASRADAGDIATGHDAVAPLIAVGTAPDITDDLALIAGAVGPATIAWAQRAMAARADSSILLAAAGVPVLIVVGELDAVTPPSVAKEMAVLAQDVEYVELPGVGHLTPAEDAAGFAGAVTRWLTRQF